MTTNYKQKLRDRAFRSEIHEKTFVEIDDAYALLCAAAAEASAVREARTVERCAAFLEWLPDPDNVLHCAAAEMRKRGARP